MSQPGKYGADHRALRRRLMVTAYGRPCARCGEPMLPGQQFDLDHRDDGPGYLGLSHRRCNIVAGAKKGRQRQLEAQQARRAMVDLKTTTAVLAVEVAVDRSKTAIVAARRIEGVEAPVIELVRRLDGTRDALAEVVAAVGSLPVAAVVIDPSGPASWLREPLTKALRGTGAKLAQPTAHDVASARGSFSEHLEGRRIKVLKHPALNDAARLAKERRLGGASALDRRSGDVAPIVAAELALWGLLRFPPRPPVAVE